MFGEPKRQTDLDLLEPYIKERVLIMLAAMRARGMDPRVFETWREQKRQQWLYGIGRKHHKRSRVVTYLDGVFEQSLHQRRKAVDIISKKWGWKWMHFFVVLKEEAERVGMHTLDWDKAHVQWEG